MISTVISLVLLSCVCNTLLATDTGDSHSNIPPAFATHQEYMLLFRHWMIEHDKQYTPQEFSVRFMTFRENVDRIMHHNNNPSYTWRMGVNQFADLNVEEFRHRHYVGANVPVQPQSHMSRRSSSPHVLHDPPTSTDWVTYGAVSPVQDQKTCSVDPIFSAVHAMESASMLDGELPTLTRFSVQQVMDCADVGGCTGDAGFDAVWSWANSNYGLCTDAAYPYIAKNTPCRSCTEHPKSYPIAAVSYVGNNEIDVRHEIGVYVPVSSLMDADEQDFIFYDDGIYDGNCGNTTVNHAVMIVGYGEDNGTLFWKVKNSWGIAWGEYGYMRIIRTTSATSIGKCALCTNASDPIYSTGGG